MDPWAPLLAEVEAMPKPRLYTEGDILEDWILLVTSLHRRSFRAWLVLAASQKSPHQLVSCISCVAFIGCISWHRRCLALQRSFGYIAVVVGRNSRQVQRIRLKLFTRTMCAAAPSGHEEALLLASRSSAGTASPRSLEPIWQTQWANATHGLSLALYVEGNGLGPP